MAYNEVPVALAGIGWLDTFLSQTAAKLIENSASLVLMPTDSHRESDFLCSRLAQFLRDNKNVRVVDVTLSPADPTLCWESLFGLPDITSQFQDHIDFDVLMIRGGNYLPKWFLDNHLAFLRAMSDAFSVRILLPVSRAVAKDVDYHSEHLEIPSLKNANKADVKAYILWAIEEFLPDLRDEGECVNRSAMREEMCELFLIDQPASRTRIDDALEFYNATFDSDCYSSVIAYTKAKGPDIAGLRFVEPSSVLAKDTLQEAFDENVKTLKKLNDDFLAVTGLPLLAPSHEYSHPFESSDPLHWFIGCVSYLGCIFFDSGKKSGLTWSLKFDCENNTLVPNDPPIFLTTLRLLRTWFQHSLNPDDVEDRKTSAFVEDWIARAIGVSDKFGRQYARLCLWRLLSELAGTIARVESVVTSLAAADEAIRINMLREMDRISRTAAEHEVLRSIMEVVSELEINVDPNVVIKKHLPQIIKDLKGSSCRLEALDAELRRLCEHYCFLVARTAPSVGKLLREKGLAPKLIGIVIETLNKEWDNDVKMTPEDYEQRAIELAESMSSEN